MIPIIGIVIFIITIIVTQVILSKKIEKEHDDKEKRINMLIAAQFLFWLGIVCIGASIISVIKDRPKIWLNLVGLLMLVIGILLFHSCHTDLFQ